MGRRPSFLNVEMQQTPRAIALMETVLRAVRPATILELGTGRGGMALYFCLYARATGAQFVTYDRDCTWTETELHRQLGFAQAFRQGDLQTAEAIEAIRMRMQQKGRVFVLCDNGHKPWEFRTFAPSLKSGDVIAVHDWGVEIGRSEVRPTVQAYGLHRICAPETEAEGMYRIWRRE